MAKTFKVLVPLPNYGCDPTEVAIPWLLLKQENISITFSTPNGEMAVTDQIMLTGHKLGLLKSILQAKPDAVNAFFKMQKSQEFRNPKKYLDIDPLEFDALLLPGGHDKGVIEYLESDLLKSCVLSFFTENKPVAAICHGVLIPARTIDPETNKSVIYDLKCTGLLKKQELLAYFATRLWLKDYYLTYPDTTTQDELIKSLKNQSQFITGPNPLLKDDLQHLKRGFFIKDKNYLSARWPGDVYNFSLEFIKMIQN
ncbi:type 1 glutamine amidotransferase domain-containing protein [Pseudoalteromonas denitrificans]|uniref:Protease I n=1 Tax=Pseudoalteromonas denitrificans DSM 6059 TaxID=1123010 RepID=A0A1I1H4R8_9GAMM|nr:type 1 glutamine amidotransferase domain-containing protein [Pseudoalteromonas denitrificans]SFC16423.1 protease I [Pseudoalteromonas denitrificans DSM 6059]